ncbi:MAG: phage integrase N-terminal SAM-like domain-containing protein [Pseudoxanthomonas sp.]|nr:phage integrase N-terminal SAM-like domain-containing protein [Pseudoxanthomonas sp.]
MDQVSLVCRRRHLSRRTEQAYRFWIRRYIHFHNRQHPRAVGLNGVVSFVNHLATAGHVAAATQSQALNALLFLYRDVLEVEVGHLAGLRRVQRRDRLPVVLTVEEVASTLGQMVGLSALMAHLLYGAGLRVTECMTLRIKDVDLTAGLIHVRAGKGGKDRTTILPSRLMRPLHRQMLRVAGLHRQDMARGAGFAPLPSALDRKYPGASQSLAWQFLFPSRVVRRCPQTGRLLRWHAS